MRVKELDELAAGRRGSPAPVFNPTPAPSDHSAVDVVLPSANARRLIMVLSAVVAVDWASKAIAWRMLPGRAMINADTSGAIPILPGLVSHPVLGAVVDAGAMMLLVIAGLWLAKTVTLGKVAWIGCALAWAGIASNAFDRWGGHLWLAPGSQRGVVDWIGVADSGSINLADVTIGVGLLLAIAALAGTRIPRRFRAAIAIGVLLLVPFSVLTVSGAATNAEPTEAYPTLQQRVRETMWVGSPYHGRRALWRVSNPGWDVSARAIDKTGLVLAQWHFASGSEVVKVYLPKGTNTVYLTLDDKGWSMTLADNLA